MNISQIKIAICVLVYIGIEINEREVLSLVIIMWDQYSNRNKLRWNGSDIGIWRLTPIWVMGRANTVLPTEGVVLKGVNVDDMQSSHRLENGRVTIHII